MPTVDGLLWVSPTWDNFLYQRRQGRAFAAPDRSVRLGLPRLFAAVEYFETRRALIEVGEYGPLPQNSEPA